jgi:hypothetical protein
MVLTPPEMFDVRPNDAAAFVALVSKLLSSMTPAWADSLARDGRFVT